MGKLVWDKELRKWVLPKKKNGTSGSDATVVPEQDDTASNSEKPSSEFNFRDYKGDIIEYKPNFKDLRNEVVVDNTYVRTPRLPMLPKETSLEDIIPNYEERKSRRIEIESNPVAELEARASGEIPPNNSNLSVYETGNKSGYATDFDFTTGSTQKIGTEKSPKGNRTYIVWGPPSEEDILNYKIFNQGKGEFKINTRGRKYKNPKYVADADLVDPTTLANVLISRNDLDIPYDNQYYAGGDTNFVDKFYPNIGADQPNEFNKLDFEGYLQKTGFIKYFTENLKEGNYGDFDSPIYSETQEKATMEIDLVNKLNEYEAYMTKRENEKRALNALLENPEKFKGVRTIQQIEDIAFNYGKLALQGEDYVYDEMGRQVEPLLALQVEQEGGLYNFKPYINNVYEDYTLYRNEELTKLTDKYQNDLKQRGNVRKAADAIFNPLLEVPVGAFEGGRDIILMVGGWLPDAMPGGGDWVRAHTLRMNQRQQYGAKSLDYFLATGKPVEIDGIKYLVAPDGSVYDTTNGVNISQLFDAPNWEGPSAEQIFMALDEDSETESDFASRGGAKMFGNVTGNIITQIAGTKGMGAVRAGTSLRALSASGKLGRFKSVGAYNKYKKVQATKKMKLTGPKYENFGANLTPYQSGLVDAASFQSLYGAAIGRKNTIQAAQRSNIDVETTEKLADMAGFQMSLLYASTSFLNPRINQVKFLDNVGKSTNKIIDRMVLAAKNNPKNPYSKASQSFTNSVKEITNKSLNKKTAEGFLVEGTKETAQENVQQAGERLLVNKNLNEALGRDFITAEYSARDVVETSIMSFAAGGLLGGVTNYGQNYTPTKLGDLYKLSQNMKGARKRFDFLVNEKLVTRRKANQLLSDAENVAYAFNNKKVPEYIAELNADTYVKMARNSKAIEDLKEQKKNLAPGLEGDIDIQIKALTDKNTQLQKGENLKLIKDDSKMLQKLGGKDKVKIFKTAKEAEDAGYKGKNLESNGFMDIDGVMVIVQDVAAENTAITVGSHELLHKILKAEFTIDGKPTELQNRILTEFKNILKQKGLYTLIENQLKENYKNFNDVHMDEWFTTFSDVVAATRKTTGLDPVKTKLIGGGTTEQMGRWFANLTGTRIGKKLQFESGKDLYEFILNYEKNFRAGKLSDLAKQKIQAGENIKSSVSKRSLSNARSKAAQDAVKNKLKNVPQPEAENSNVVKENLPGMISVQISNLAATLDAEPAYDMTIDAYLRMTTPNKSGKVVDLSWDGRGTLYGFLNGRIRKRLLDILREDRKRPDPIYINAIQTDAIARLEKETTTDTDTDTKTAPEVKQYKKLKDSGIVTTEVKNQIEKDLVTIARLLKTGVQEGIGKNKKITPFMRELMKSIDQSNIPNRVDFGTGDALVKRLLKHKKAIIENSTRTFLMGQDRSGKVAGGIPVAIDKTIVNADGTTETVSYPNWAGKKVARESTSANSAGRTAGHDLTFKKKAEQVSDADYLKSFFKTVTKNADGTFTVKGLIPGRKPAIEKHVSQMLGVELFIDGIENGSIIADNFSQSKAMIDAEIEVSKIIPQLVADGELGGTKRSVGMMEFLVASYLTGRNSVTYKQALTGLSENELKVWQENILPIFENANYRNEVKKLMSTDEFAKALAPQMNDFINAKGSGEVMQSQMEAFIDPFLSVLPEDVRKAMPDGMFALFQGYLNPSAKKKGTAAGRRLKIKKNSDGKISNLWWLSSFAPMQAGSGKMLQIQNVLNQNISKAAKIELLKKKGLWEGLKDIKEANNAAYIYLIQQGISVVANDPSTLPGFLQWIGSSSNIGKALRSLTGLSDIQILDGSQAPYTNAAKTKFGTTPSSVTAKPVLGENVFVNREHSLFSDAEKIAKEKNGGTIPANEFDSKVGKELAYKGEHSDPSSYISLQTVETLLPIVKLAIESPTEIELINTIIDLELSPIIETFNQQLNATFVSDLQDGALGRTSKAGAIRLLVEPKYLNTFVKTPSADTDVMQRAGQALRKLGIDRQGVINNRVAIRAELEGTKRSVGKGISVYDFDDTLAFSKSKIGVTSTYQGQKETIFITPAEFAVDGEILAQQGAEFDFSQFNKVVKGTPGPLIPRLKKAIGKFGNENIYVLTARPQASAKAIHGFLKGLGLEIPLRNIVGLENGSPAAKAGWMINKVAQGFNDFYFVDDAIKNVKAVKAVLDQFDVNSKVQQAVKRSAGDLSGQLNEMIFRNKGVKPEAVFSKVVARRQGSKKGRFKFFVPHGAEDFRGLTSYTLAGKGKQGEADQKFFEANLVDPYVRGVAAMEMARQALKTDYKKLLKDNKSVKRKLNKKIGGTEYTHDQAIRVYLYTKGGFDIPGISKRDAKLLNKLVASDPELKTFADALSIIGKTESWIAPEQFWDVGSILKDLNNISEKVSRKQYLAEFIENKNEIFSENNLNKLEAIYGTRYTDALKNILGRMESGINRPAQPGRYEQKWLNWVNNSVGTIMFFNRRSALLQMLSFANFVNWSDNNPMNAALAFANQPAYWRAWTKIFNSAKLKQRRGGLKSDIQEQEIANQARNSKNKADAVIAYLLKIGFTPTQIADSMAIATGGATFLINRTKTYKKQGLSNAEAEAKAFEDFSKISDETQQSGDPMLISAQQASHLGRLILAFQNTPMQYTRLMKKAGQDLINGRGDAKTNISKIMYYGFVQNLIFSALQNALFALLPEFDPEEDEEKYEKLIETKQARIINSMVDTIMRGSGLTGAVASTIKNVLNQYYRQEKKGFMADHAYTLIEVANISPPIGSKLRKVYSGIQTAKFDKDVIEERGWSVMADGKFNPSPKYQILGNYVSAGLNLPLDRAILEVQGITEALDSRNTAYQRIALGLGWRTWGVNAKNEEHELIKTEAKARRKAEGIEKGKQTRKENSNKLKALEKDIPLSKYSDYLKWKKGKTIKEKIKYLESL